MDRPGRDAVSLHPSVARTHRIALALLAAYIFLAPFQFTLYLSADDFFRVGPSDLALFALVVLCAQQIRVVRPAWTIWHTALLFLLPVSAMVVSLMVAPVALAVLVAKVFGMGILSILYLAITSFVTTWEQTRRLLALLAWVVVIQNVVVTALYVARIPAPFINGDGTRLSGMLPDPNAYGSLLIVTFALLLTTIPSNRPLLGPRATRIAAITLPLSIALTSSRTTWVAFAAVLMLYAFARPGTAMKYVVFVGVALVAVFMFMAPDLTEQQIALGTRGTGGRFELAAQTLDAFWPNPIFGTGIGEFAREHGVIIHNTAGWFLGEFGLVGLLIIGGLMGTIALRAWSLYRLSDEPDKSLALGLGLAFIGMGVMSLGIEALYQRWWWVIMAMIGGMHTMTMQQVRAGRTRRGLAIGSTRE
jgi:O-antigen ligase